MRHPSTFVAGRQRTALLFVIPQAVTPQAVEGLVDLPQRLAAQRGHVVLKVEEPVGCRGEGRRGQPEDLVGGEASSAQEDGAPEAPSSSRKRRGESDLVSIDHRKLCRIVTSGSILLERRAGSQLARAAVRARRASVTVNVRGSRGLTP